MNHKLKKLALLLGDVIILYSALYLALVIRYLEQPDQKTWELHFWPFTIIFMAWIMIFYIADLYNLRLAVNNSAFLRKTLRTIMLAGVLAAIFFYLNPDVTIAPKTNLAIFVAVFAGLLLLWRWLYNRILSAYLPKEHILLVGFNELAREMASVFAANPHLGYRISAVLADSDPGLPDVPFLNDLDRLKPVVEERRISTIILASDPHLSSRLRTALFSCLPLKVNITNLPAFYETITGRVPTAAIGEMWFLENLAQGKRVSFDAMKKFYDFALALSALALLFPFWLIVIAAIKLESPGPAFFRQKRLGKDNKVFSAIKFRSMYRTDYLSPTKSTDQRITRVGGFLRKTRLDETPQLINVLKGDMSFVGPRPERPEHAAELEKDIPFYRERLLVKPGLTGPDQISGEYHSPSKEDTLKKLQYDLYYVKNRSIYLDLSIILKTVATVLKAAGR